LNVVRSEGMGNECIVHLFCIIIIAVFTALLLEIDTRRIFLIWRDLKPKVRVKDEAHSEAIEPRIDV